MGLHFEEIGNIKASTIVFIHGGLVLSSWMWEKQMHYFKDYHCIIPDLPEHGKSFRNGKISISRCADEIAKIIEKRANGGKANIIGYSYSSKIVINLLISRPELISHAIVASPLSRPVPIMRFAQSPNIIKLITHIIKSNTVKSFLIKSLNFPCNSYRINCMKEIHKLTHNKIYRIFNEFCTKLKLPDDLKKVRIPTLIIAGEKESKPMKQSVIDMTRLIPSAKGVLLKHGSHTHPWSMHEAFNIVVESWINNEQTSDKYTILI
ncbi:alpha/beta hydrolase [Herbivorax sp. ANBcel31]|uniref:alpha/beta fold hydrolase n=1 Tax=Herbivorax sp. ANBcel31 TaxID=3069754 RepID=UPI0027B08669|nr:alpha/beta hydrolase [Herbivorax sp. ANBcel31]MDQ2087117.1 alpha/beta hydrolase [Herbivorax sp. ANBcel31]